MDNLEFKLVEDGIEREYETMAFIEMDDKKYIWYKEKNTANDESLISRYNIVDGKLEVIPITDMDEWNKVADAFNKGE